MKEKHIAVLLKEVLESFKDSNITTFFDGTLGFCGHAKALLEDHPEIKKYIAVDQDIEALKEAKETLNPWQEKVSFQKDNFSNLDDILKKEKIEKVDGFLFDIGVSSMQLDDAKRGFSFNKDAFLDMRMDLSKKITAAEVVNSFSEKKLEEIFREYGEEPQAKKIAKKIIETRAQKEIKTTKQLAEVISEVKSSRRKIHPATLVFQALRIYVNDELNVLKTALKKALEKLSINGKIAVISFHSLEDGIVKNLFKSVCKKKHVNIYRKDEEASLNEPKYLLLTKKPITPSLEEIKNNKRSRSSKLRVIQKVG